MHEIIYFPRGKAKTFKTKMAQITDYGEDDGFTELSFLAFHTRTREDDVLIAKITVFRTFSIFFNHPKERQCCHPFWVESVSLKLPG